MRSTRLLLAGSVAAVLTLAMLRLAVVDVLEVSSDSMSPSLCAGDRIVVLTAGGRDGLVEGDVVVFTDPLERRLTVKRVVAAAGREVAVRDGVLHVDGRPIGEPFVDRAAVDGTYFGPVQVPPRSLFVLGDERGHSVDSRDYGPIPLSSVRGRVLFRWWSGPACG